MKNITQLIANVENSLCELCHIGKMQQLAALGKATHSLVPCREGGSGNLMTNHLAPDHHISIDQNES